MIATWPQLVVGGGGILLVCVGVAAAVLLLPHVNWRRESASGLAYLALLSAAPTAAGLCFIVAAVLRSHDWELAGAILLVGGIAVQRALARRFRKRAAGRTE
jgi:hypothetical protein